MNVTIWDTEQNSQTPWKDGRRDRGSEKRKKKGEKERDRKSCLTEEIKI